MKPSHALRPDIRFIGAGGAHDIHLGNSAALLKWESKHFLIDCGFTVYPRLVQHRLIESIDAVLITHLHDDHIGSLSAFLYHRHFISKKSPVPVLAGPSELRQKLTIYLVYLMGEPLERFAEIRPPEAYAPYLEAIDTSYQHMPHMPSAAYLFKSPSLNVLYSGDIGRPLQMLTDPNWLDQHPNLWVFHDVSFVRTPTHAYYQDLAPYVHKCEIWGYHCDPANAPADNPIPLVHNRFLLA